MDVLRRLWLLLSLVFLVLLPLAASSRELDQNNLEQAWEGPSGRYRILDFAAAWCLPCWKVLPRLQSYADSHPELDVWVVSVDTTIAERDRLVRDLGLRIPVIWDEEQQIAEHYQPTGMPATFVLDPEGRIVHSYVGSGQREWMEMVEFMETLSKR